MPKSSGRPKVDAESNGVFAKSQDFEYQGSSGFVTGFGTEGVCPLTGLLGAVVSPASAEDQDDRPEEELSLVSAADHGAAG